MFGRCSAAGIASLDGIAWTAPAIPDNGSNAADNNNSFFIGERKGLVIRD